MAQPTLKSTILANSTHPSPLVFTPIWTSGETTPADITAGGHILLTKPSSASLRTHPPLRRAYKQVPGATGTDVRPYPIVPHLRSELIGVSYKYYWRYPVDDRSSQSSVHIAHIIAGQPPFCVKSKLHIDTTRAQEAVIHIWNGSRECSPVRILLLESVGTRDTTVTIG